MNFHQRRMLRSMKERLLELECQAQRIQLVIDEHEQEKEEIKRKVEQSKEVYLTSLRYIEIDIEIETLRRKRLFVEMESLQEQVDETLRKMSQSQAHVQRQ